MPFPLPIDPDFRKAIIVSWIEDCEDRVMAGQLDQAFDSLRIANSLYLGLPAGQGDEGIEKALVEVRVKLGKHQSL
jgi:hypothetical protein